MLNNKRLQKRQEDIHIKNTIAGIQSITPHIHRVRLSTDAYNYDDIANKLGKIFIPNDSEEQARRRMPPYRKMGIIKKYGVVFFSPLMTKQYYPQLILEIANVTASELIDLHSKAPEFKVSYIEYAIDFGVRSPEHAAKIFSVLMKTMYFPYARSVEMRGTPYYGWMEPREGNSVYKANSCAIRKNTEVVIYERGPDSLQREKRWWAYKDIDRVRLEFREFRKSQKLQKIGVDSLADLIESPRFSDYCFPKKGQNKIQFKCFEDPNLPKYWERYSFGEEMALESFQAEFLDRKEKITNINRCKADHPLFISLLKRIRLKIKEFDKNWL
ncbi:MAG: hypothetical protein SWH61_05220 [Thermodesulfobacteriota bacterium]|nr:hypothetical protein [Thermodesulfobacteriota bacterium]